MQKKYLNIAVAGALAAMSVGAHAADTYFGNFTPLAASAGPTSTPATPITLSSPNFSQVTIADRATQLAKAAGSNSGSWDMITANETGTNAGRYLFMPFETNTGGVQRVDLWDNNYNTRTVTIVAPGSQNFVSGDASRWTPWGQLPDRRRILGYGQQQGPSVRSHQCDDRYCQWWQLRPAQCHPARLPRRPCFRQEKHHVLH